MQQPQRLSDVLSGYVIWQQGRVEAGETVLAMARKGQVEGELPLTIYIEGDGQAYLSRGQVSGNPTPPVPVALNLAMEDTAADIIYLARPCQFVDFSVQRECLDRSLYTTRRWAPEVVEGYRQAIMTLAPTRQVELIGYSGGAYLALAVAGSLPRGKVVAVTTLAGNLSPDAVNAHHDIPPMEQLAPLEWRKLAAIPQVHYTGTRDEVIPLDLQTTYIKEAGLWGQAAVDAGFWRWIEVDANHEEGWTRLMNP